MFAPMKILKVVCFIFCLSANLYAQDPLRFEKEIATLKTTDSLVEKKKLILFTGSSSIRLWKDLKTSFLAYNIVNRGFGGSETSDLVYYFDQLILPYQPKKIFIYEGDNDINSGKTPERILSDMDQLMKLVRTKLSPSVKVFIISPKPSIARWALKDKYVVFNAQLKAWTRTQKRVKFIDVWTPALDHDGKVLSDIFVADNLHMNKKGYDIWVKVIGPYLR